MQISFVQQPFDNLQRNSFEAVLARRTDSTLASQNVPFIRVTTPAGSVPYPNATSIRHDFDINFDKAIQIKNIDTFISTPYSKIYFDLADNTNAVLLPIEHKKAISIYLTNGEREGEVLARFKSKTEMNV